VEIVDALELVPCILNDETRAQVISLLSPRISGAIPHYSQRRPHVLGILTTCLNYEYGINELLSLIASFEGDSHPYRHLLGTLRHYLPEEDGFNS
jgi:hypothetical protein